MLVETEEKVHLSHSGRFRKKITKEIQKHGKERIFHWFIELIALYIYIFWATLGDNQVLLLDLYIGKYETIDSTHAPMCRMIYSVYSVELSLWFLSANHC